MRNTTLGLLFALGLTQSCAESTTPELNMLRATVSYTAGSYSPFSNEMIITADGVVQAEQVDRSMGTTLESRWLQLSTIEINELKKLLEAFVDFDRFYEDPQAPTDGPYVYIAYEKEGVTRETSVYPASYEAIPDELKALKAMLDELFTKALEE